jgi:hypothetical protein
MEIGAAVGVGDAFGLVLVLAFAEAVRLTDAGGGVADPDLRDSFVITIPRRGV